MRYDDTISVRLIISNSTTVQCIIFCIIISEMFVRPVSTHSILKQVSEFVDFVEQEWLEQAKMWNKSPFCILEQEKSGIKKVLFHLPKGLLA